VSYDPEVRRSVWIVLLFILAVLAAVALEVFAEFSSFLFPGGEGLPRWVGVTAAASGALWLALLLVVRIARVPPRPPTGPPTEQLRDEPPALANMLVNRFRPDRDAVPATLLDLAARGLVRIEEGRGQRTVRVRQGSLRGTVPYEQAILFLIQSKAGEGAVPAAALTTGSRRWAGGWWRSFRAAVERDAKVRGLSRDLWDQRTLAWLGAAGLVPAVLTGIAAGELMAGVAVMILVVAILAGVKSRGRQRETSPGLEAASAWLGIRRHLRDASSFEYLPAGAVVVWERHLAYGAALGLAPEAIRHIAMGADRDGGG
jgi:Predicted membrane protein (DUF2207)